MIRYPEYRESGIEWIGEMPKHWSDIPLKHVTTYNDELLPANTNPNFEFQYVEISDVDQFTGVGIGKLISFAEAPSRARRVLQTNDVLISTVRTYLRAIGTISQSNSPLIASTGFCVLRATSRINWSYLSYFVKTEYFVSAVVANSEGVSYPAINAIALVRLKTLLPPIEEQTQISQFLDEKTFQVESLIKKLERKIELLKEYRTSLINKCVTKGLDSDVEMKDSGIEWIGEIPKHWEIKKITYITSRIGSGTTPKSDNESYYRNGTTPWLVTGDLIDKRISKVTNQITSRALDDYSALKIWPSHSLVIAMYGATIGKLGLLNFPSTVNQACCVCEFTSDNSPKYWFYAMLASRMRILSMSYGGGQPNISQDLLKSLRFASPTLPVQIQISQFLDKKTSQIDPLIEKLQRKIELLKEYRQSLISNVVTGKVRVVK